MVGDTIDVAFWSGVLGNLDLDPETVVAPIGVEHLRVAGFGRLPDEVLPDELYPRQRLIVSPDVARRYTCRGDLRPDMDAETAFAAIYPEGCSRQYEYFSLDLEPTPGATADVQRAFGRVVDRLSEELPRSNAQGDGLSYFYVAQDRADVEADVRRVTRPTVTALIVFAVIAGLATLAVAAVAVSRILARDVDAQRTLRSLGATTRQRALVAALPIILTMLVGVSLALPVALLASVVGPAGSVRAVTPSPGMTLPLEIALPLAALLVLAFSAVTVGISWGAARRAAPFEERAPRRSWYGSAFLHRPAAAQGVGAALSPRRGDGGVAVLLGCVIALATVTAAVVFGSNLDTLVNEPTRYGWPWDVVAITGAGYGDTAVDAVDESIDGRDDVVDHAYFAFDSAAALDGHPVSLLSGFPGAERSSFPLIEGRQARKPGEVVVGATTAAALDLHPGDRTEIRASRAPRQRATVVGVGVLPALGPFAADRTGLGTGVFALVGADPADPELENPAAMTAINLDDATTPRGFVDDLGTSVRESDALGAQPVVLTSAVRPSEIVNAESMRTAPLALGAVLALGLTVGLALAIAVSVRDRRRELAILRSLGFRGRELWASTVWQAVASIAVGIVVGIPLGLAAGRFAWSLFVDQLGVVADTGIPYVWLAAIALGALALALLAAAPAARSAARVAPGPVLNDVT